MAASINDGLVQIFDSIYDLSPEAWQGLIIILGSIAFAAFVARNLKSFANFPKGLSNLVAWFMTILGLYFILGDVRNDTLGFISGWFLFFALIGATIGMYFMFKRVENSVFHDSNMFTYFYKALLVIFFLSGVGMIYEKLPPDNYLTNILDAILLFDDLVLVMLVAIAFVFVGSFFGGFLKKKGTQESGDAEYNDRVDEAANQATNDTNGVSSNLNDDKNRIARNAERLGRNADEIDGAMPAGAS